MNDDHLYFRVGRSGLQCAAPSMLRCAAVLSLLALASCKHHPWSDERFLEVRVPSEKLHEVDALDVDEFADPETENDIDALTESPPEKVELSLADCRRLALQSNLDLQVALFSPSIAATAVTEEEARFESAFTAATSYTESERQVSSTLTSSEANSTNSSLGVRIPLRTGGTITVDLPFNRNDRDLQFNTLNPSFDAELNFSLTHNLLRGAGLRANTHGIRIAMYQQQSQSAQAKLEVTRILAEVDRQYWFLYAVRRELEVRQLQYELAVAQYERAQRLVNAEQAAEVEVLRAESGVADTLEQIIIAQNRVLNRQRQLKRLLNAAHLPVGGGTALITTTDPNPLNLELDGAQLSAVALEQRMEMLQIELQIAQNASTIDFEKNQALPLLALDYSYGFNAVDDSYGDAFDTLLDREFDGWRIGVRGEIPIGNEAAEARVHRAILNRLQSIATKQQREQLIRQEVLDAIDSLNASWQRVLASAQRVVLAERTLRAEERQYDLGLRTSTDVLDAQARLADAQSSEIAALTSYQISQTDLAYATGMVLGQAQVRWEPLDVDDTDLADNTAVEPTDRDRDSGQREDGVAP
jgi:outer membrane protein TolC